MSQFMGENGLPQSSPLNIIRAGHLEFVVLQCSFKSNFQASLTGKNAISGTGILK